MSRCAATASRATRATMGFAPKQHFEIGEALGHDGFRDGGQACPARASSCSKGPLARLERALGQFMLDLHTGEHGYTEVNPPLLVRDEAIFGTAQLPKFEEDLFFRTQLRTSTAMLWRRCSDDKLGRVLRLWRDRERSGSSPPPKCR